MDSALSSGPTQRAVAPRGPLDQDGELLVVTAQPHDVGYNSVIQVRDSTRSTGLSFSASQAGPESVCAWSFTVGVNGPVIDSGPPRRRLIGSGLQFFSLTSGATRPTTRARAVQCCIDIATGRVSRVDAQAERPADRVSDSSRGSRAERARRARSRHRVSHHRHLAPLGVP